MAFEEINMRNIISAEFCKFITDENNGKFTEKKNYSTKSSKHIKIKPYCKQ